MDRETLDCIATTLRVHFSKLQAVYLFGSAVYEDFEEGSKNPETADNLSKDQNKREEKSFLGDIDIAVLLPPAEARGRVPTFLQAREELEERLSLPVDLVNLRNVSTVFKNEIISTGKRIFTEDLGEVDTFEMLTRSLYQKLNEERKEILEDFFETKRAYKL